MLLADLLSYAGMLERKITRLALLIAFSLLCVMWLVFLTDYFFDLNLYRYGIYPHKLSGIIGIFAAPFIHSTADFGHIFNNSIPAFILTWLLFYHYRTIATRVFLLIYFLTGISMWLLARESYHIGMSGVIYGLSSFLVFSGFFRKNMRVAAVSLFVIFLYGSMIWGIFPSSINISWEGHALGLFSGIIAAVIFKYRGPQPQKMIYEIEEELGIEPEFEYWKEPDSSSVNPVTNPEKTDPIIIRYEYKPNLGKESSEDKVSN